MLKYAVRRILQAIPLLLLTSAVIFFGIRLLPGRPLGLVPRPADIERLGLDKPIYIQYLFFLRNALSGDLGNSFRTGVFVIDEMKARYLPTIILAAGGTAVSSLIGITSGITAALKHNKITDSFILVFSLIFVSMPLFFLSLILMLLFCLRLGLLPSGGLATWKGGVLPILALGLPAVGFVTRTTRTAMLEVLGKDYIRTSRARGIPERTVVYVHAFKNALVPVLTAVGMRFGELLAGATIVETVFAIPGMGRVIVESITLLDYPMIQASVLYMAATFIVINVIFDLLYAVVNPSIRYS